MQHVPEELGGIPELVDLHLVDVVVCLNEELEELGRVQVRVEQAEPLREEPVEPQVGALLGATL